MIKCVIVDDEVHAIEALKWKLDECGHDVSIIAQFQNPIDALSAIPGLDFHLLFLDIQMPSMTGFELLDNLPSKQFAVIFVTAHDEHMLQALRASALDYLLKPVAMAELSDSLMRLDVDAHARQLQDKFEQFKAASERNAPSRIALPTSESIVFVEKSDILYCQSDSNYTTVYIASGDKVLLSKSLKHVESMLGANFIRTHNSYLVNTTCVKAYLRGSGGSLELTDGTVIPVSRNRKEDVLTRLQLM